MRVQKKIVRVYSKPNCVQCDWTKKLLTDLGIEFVEEDLLDEGNLMAAKYLGFMSAPVVAAGDSADDMWSGFQPERIKDLAKRIK